MAFFDEKIDELSKRNPPQSVQDCLRTDGVSQTLWEWAMSIENWGRVVLILLIIGGCIIAVLTGMQVGRETLGDDTLPVLGTVFFTALQWGLYALIEYCVYHAVSLLMCSLQSRGCPAIREQYQIRRNRARCGREYLEDSDNFPVADGISDNAYQFSVAPVGQPL